MQAVTQLLEVRAFFLTEVTVMIRVRDTTSTNVGLRGEQAMLMNACDATRTKGGTRTTSRDNPCCLASPRRPAQCC